MSDTLKISLHEIIEEPISGTRPKGGVNFDGEIPSFGGENVTMEGGLTYYPVKKVSLDFFNQMNRGQLQELDVLINKDGANTGKSTIYRKSPYNRACINEHLFILRGKPSQLDQVYFHYLLQSSEIKQGIERKITGSAQPGLNSQFCRNFPIEIVPLPEQKKIASILTSVDEVIENTQKQIDKLQDLKKATMNELLTKGIGHTEFKDSELGRIPKSWEVYALSEIGTFSKGRGISKKETLLEGVPCLRYAEIYTVYDFYIKTFKSFISPITAESSRKLIKNEIIFAGSGETVEDIGKSVAFTLDCDAYVGGDSVVFSPRSGLDSIFLSYQLNDNIRRRMLRKLGQGSSVIHIYSSGLQEVLVSLPPLSEQKKIASILISMGEAIEEKLEESRKLQSLKKSLMQDLLTGKVRVMVN
ncbi:restriction endonuclease subunit S [Porticoccaceae bacterium]|nr:restriction endonuclease subunit S [Porticoccaceae bacterium]